jgi:isopenicillin N synthase-like dioxygenase
MTATPDIPLIEVSRWRTGDAAERAALAARLDRAMQDSGFFLVSGHGISVGLREQLRQAARRFFALPAADKEPLGGAAGSPRAWRPTPSTASSRTRRGPTSRRA